MIRKEDLPKVLAVTDQQIDSINADLNTFRKRGTIYQAVGMRKHCPQCLASENPKMVFPTGNVNSPIMFITDHISQEDIENRSPLTDADGAIFQFLLEKLGINKDNIYVTSLYKCEHSHEDMASKFVCVTSALCVEILTVMPKVIVGMGEEVKNVLLAVMDYPVQSSPLEDIRNKVHKIEFDDKTFDYIQTYSVSDVAKDFDRLSRAFGKDIVVAMKVAGIK